MFWTLNSLLSLRPSAGLSSFSSSAFVAWNFRTMMLSVQGWQDSCTSNCLQTIANCLRFVKLGVEALQSVYVSFGYHKFQLDMCSWTQLHIRSNSFLESSWQQCCCWRYKTISDFQNRWNSQCCTLLRTSLVSCKHVGLHGDKLSTGGKDLSSLAAPKLLTSFMDLLLVRRTSLTTGSISYLRIY